MIAAVLLEAEGLLEGRDLAPAVIELLRRIHADGRLVGVVSLGGPAALESVQASAAGELVHTLEWGSSALERASAALAFRPADMAVVATSPALIRAAREAGARRIGLSGTSGAAELRAHGAEEVHPGVPALLEGFRGSLLGTSVLALSDQNTG